MPNPTHIPIGLALLPANASGFDAGKVSGDRPPRISAVSAGMPRRSATAAARSQNRCSVYNNWHIDRARGPMLGVALGRLTLRASSSVLSAGQPDLYAAFDPVALLTTRKTTESVCLFAIRMVPAATSAQASWTPSRRRGSSVQVSHSAPSASRGRSAIAVPVVGSMGMECFKDISAG
jgi:hypothetical protein